CDDIGMSLIVSNPLYNPVGSLPFSLLKPNAPADDSGAMDLFNAQMQAIAAAFASLSFPNASVSVNTQLTAASRSVLVDLSSLVNSGNAIVITLPTGPSIGDPSSVIVVQKPGYHTAGSTLESVVIVTSTDELISGVTQDNVGYTTQIPLFNA